MNQLTIGGIMSNAVKLGLKNALSLLGAIILWILTFWIPYLNVGTTIGLVGIVVKMGRGEVVSPTEIFNPTYRKQMGEFFLVTAFMAIGIYIGMAFMVIPGIVIAIAWSLAPLLVLDKNLNPSEALQASNNYTNGRKITIFFSQFLLALGIMVAFGIVGGILIFIASLIHEVLAALLMIVVYIVAYASLMFVTMGSQAYIYNMLVEGGSGVAAALGQAPAPAGPPGPPMGGPMDPNMGQPGPGAPPAPPAPPSAPDQGGPSGQGGPFGQQ